MFLVDIHCRFALTTIFYALALGVWAAFGFFLRRGVTGGFFGALVIGQVFYVLQGLGGIVLILTGRWPPDILHFLYGVVIVITWPGVFAYTQGERGRRELGFYALASFFIFGLAIRGIMTGTSGTLICFPR